MTREEIAEIIKELHKENLNSKQLTLALNKLLKFRAELPFNHPHLAEVNNTIANSQYLLKLKIDQESNSLLNLAKRGLVTETLKFMVPFLLGFFVAWYGLPNFSKSITPESSSQKSTQQQTSQAK